MLLIAAATMLSVVAFGWSLAFLGNLGNALGGQQPLQNQATQAQITIEQWRLTGYVSGTTDGSLVLYVRNVGAFAPLQLGSIEIIGTPGNGGLRNSIFATQQNGAWTLSTAPTSGTASSGTATTLTDSGKTWTANQWAGYFVTISAGTGKGQLRTISSNTATALTVSSAWATTPDSTSQYSVAAVQACSMQTTATDCSNAALASASLSSTGSAEIFVKWPNGTPFTVPGNAPVTGDTVTVQVGTTVGAVKAVTITFP